MSINNILYMIFCGIGIIGITIGIIALSAIMMNMALDYIFDTIKKIKYQLRNIKD